MAGLGGFAKLSPQQQATALEELTPALINGTRALDSIAGHKQDPQADTSELDDLASKLSSCLRDIQMLITEIESGNARDSILDPDEVTLHCRLLISEVKSLSSQIREAQSRIVARTRK